MTYPIYYVNEGLSVVPSEAVNHLSRPPVRKDCLDEGEEFILGNGVVDQALPYLLAGVGGDGWIGGIAHMP